MQQYLKNLDRIEFVVTLACSGKCKHCSQGDHIGNKEHIDGDKGADLIRQVCDNYKINSIMTFGGEPLLFAEEVFKIHKAAQEVGISKRHIITNGYFSKDEKKIKEVADKLVKCGVTKVMLSVDAFHQETIPLELVKIFAKIAKESDVEIKTHPAWLVSKEDNNIYNVRTKEILQEFETMGIDSSKGNIIFPSGNAIRYLGNYFDENIEYINRYEVDPFDVRTISISPEGNVLNGNIYKKEIMDILAEYNPENIRCLKKF